MGAWGVIRKAKEFWSWLKFVGDILGLLGLLAIVTGAGATIVGVVWAMITGLPAPIIFMAGFCTFVGAVYLAMVPVAIQALAQPRSQQKETLRPNLDAWRHVKKLSLSDASKLWCDIDPNSPTTRESISWLRAFQDAIRRGELKFIPKYPSNSEYTKSERERAQSDTEIRIEDLRDWAKKHGYSPKFLS